MTDTATSNAEPYSVSELAFALKRTLETTYGFVRLRGELSKVTRHASGHVYLTLKDDKAAIDGVIWKGSVRTLSVQPEQGLEVIATGKITTFPGASKYQIVIETMEVAGVGALLAQLERLKARLADEGLFAPQRKQPLPAMPAVVGVITSPTGAVIRDILHRIRDRWPCRVIVWPVVVQGDAAAPQVAAAIRGFNAMAPDGPIPRPDILIVARGGGSVEDLWAFNDETLARTVAAGTIPLISAVGHETDTTLIDFVSDRRAPTPTAAAEMATPVLAELRAAIVGLEQRHLRAGQRVIEDRRTRLTATSRGLPRKEDLTAALSQRLDFAASHLTAGLRRNVDLHARRLAEAASPLRPGLLRRRVELGADRIQALSTRLDAALARAGDTGPQQRRLEELHGRLNAAVTRQIVQDERRLTGLEKLRLSLNPDGPLARGFARVTRADGKLARSAAILASGEGVILTFADGARGAVIDGEASVATPPEAPQAPKPAPKPRPAPPPNPSQGDLF